MKTLLLFTTVVILSVSAFSQSSDSTYKNEIGLDASTFIKYYIDFVGVNYYTNPEYFLHYKHHFEPGNLRAAFGTSYTREQEDSRYDFDSAKYYNTEIQFNLSVGWEWVNKINNHWSVHYGADLVAMTLNRNYEADDFEDNYAIQMLSQSYIFGSGPILGLRYSFTPRISLTTETSYQIFRSVSNSKYIYHPLIDNLQELPNYEEPDFIETYTLFTPPASLIFSLQF